MRFGTIFLGYGILLFLLYVFGIVGIEDNTILNILVSGGEWNKALYGGSFGLWGSSFLSITAIMGFVVSAGAFVGSKVFGVVPNRFLVFGGILAFIVGSYLDTISPIIYVFPEDFRIIGYLIYGVLSFVFIWTAIEFWGGVE